jgi:NADH-quinone oxidoreductase subunit H
MGASTELSVFMAGWSSRNKYSLLGAMRAVAQMISYEVPLLMSSVAVVMITGSLSLDKIVEAQNQYTWGLPHWYIFTPWGFAGFVMFAIAATAETNRSPFDLPEGESELVAGYFTEYSGFKFALFFLGEYVACFDLRTGTTLFLGGWSRRCRSWLGAVVDLVLRQGDAVDVRVYLAARNAAAAAAGPVDELCLEVCAAVYAAQPVCAALWRFMGDGWARWVVCSAILLACLCGDGPGGDAQEALWAEELSLCGVS